MPFWKIKSETLAKLRFYRTTMLCALMISAVSLGIVLQIGSDIKDGRFWIENTGRSLTLDEMLQARRLLAALGLVAGIAFVVLLRKWLRARRENERENTSRGVQ